MITFEFSERYSDVADIHDALYSYNLSKTKLKRVAVYAERYREQGALLARDENVEKAIARVMQMREDLEIKL